MPQSLLEKLIRLSKEVKMQEELNEKNVFEFLVSLEKFFQEILSLKEEVWVDSEISGYESNNIFGWAAENDLDYHIVVAQRDTFNIPGTEEVNVHGSYLKNILDLPKGLQNEVFNKSDLLLIKIHEYLLELCKQSKRTGSDIIAKINKITELLNDSNYAMAKK